MTKQQTKTVESEAENKKASEKIEVTIPQKTISQIITTLRTLVEDSTLTFTPEGLSVKCMDCSHVALIDIGLTNIHFEKYEVDNDVSVAIRLDDSIKMVSLFEPNSNVRISHNDDHVLNFHNKSESYKIRTITPNKTDCPLPRIPYDSTISFNQEITLADFLKQLKKIETVSDYVTFKTERNWFTLSGKGDAGDAEIKNERGQVSISKHDSDSESTYSLEYLIPFLKTIQKDHTIEIAYSTAKPLRIRVNLGSENPNLPISARIDFYLAPRVES